MHHLYIVIFWISLFLLLYGYIGYGVILTLINSLKYGKTTLSSTAVDYTPDIAFLVAAYNEEDCIEDKINNTLGLDYPKEKLHLYIIADGSTDRTKDFSITFPDVIVHHQPERLGKLASLQRIIPNLKEEIILFSDANCLLNRDAVRHLIQHFTDPSVGAVSGEKKVVSGTDATATEGIYWKYESWLKNQDSLYNTIVGAAGELFCMRKDLYEKLPSEVILEDFVQSMKVCGKGYRVAYEKNAYATEAPSGSLKEEFERKIRICAGAFQSLRYIKFAFNPFLNGKLFFQFISHRFLRWTLSPVALVLVFISNLMIRNENEFYYFLFVVQCLFYAIALTGLMMSLRKLKAGLLYVPIYFTLMNLAVFAGFFRFVKGSQSNVWKKAERKTAITQEKSGR
jgi:cellulose synthase/poly-beta-1,6-N-acetylglucosamine synthase-like glycosyltransferase